MTRLLRIHQMMDVQVASRPEAVAMVDTDGRAVIWRKLADHVDEAADVLRAQGVGPGDRVLIVAENCVSVAVLVMACSRLDAWAVPVNARLTKAEIDRVTAHAGPKVAIYTSHVSAEATAHADAAGARSCATGCGALRLAPCVPGAAEAPEPGADQVAVILYTTGTTGAPKGVMLTHGNLIFAAKASRDLRALTPDDLLYGALPLTHVFGLASMMLAAMCAGSTVALAVRFSAAAMFDALRQGASVVPAVPRMHALLMDHAARHGYERADAPRLRYVSSGAAPLDPAWKRKAEAFYGLPLQNGYGMTETTAGVSGTRNALGDPDTSVGLPLPGVAVRIDASVGAEPGVGEVLTGGPHIMKGYFGDAEATARVLTPDGFMRTGDLGRIDDAGRLHIVGRTKELIIRGGFNVYPPEVETALNDHPAVVQSAVIGRPAEGDEEVLAFCEISEPGAVTEADLAAFAGARLAGYKRPSRVFIVEALPTAPTGKILKQALLDHFSHLIATGSNA